ncbi:hypothetical protein [Sphingomonas jaspsi]|uniref:hypothetical protein n=1 Tax=Sphingomonas jaspsi TaxID=392409 RepID=UPI0004B35F94|nr:hypothetical protein [Sphingomonas jaspsi]
MIHIYDGNNVMLRDLDKVGHERIGLRRRFELCNDGAVHIWCWDGRNHNQRRRDIYADYKAQRTPMAEDRFAQIGVFREALTHSNAIQVECDGWEADDVVGALVHRFVSRQVGGNVYGKSADLKVKVYSNDLDYWQLMQYRNVIIDGIRPTGIPNCEPHHIPLFKALVGDKSDNIKGVPGFGLKSWDSLSLPDRRLLQRAVDEANTELVAQLKLPTRARNLLLDPAMLDEARRAISITRFIPVPEDTLNKGMKPGVLNREAANDLFRRFFL